jgi:hypothetical protein
VHDDNPENLEELDIKIQEYQRLLKTLKTKNRFISEKRSMFPVALPGIISLIVFSPVFIYGWINNLLAYYPAAHFSKKMKDPQFISSIKYGIGLVTFPLFYLIQTVLFYVFTKDIYYTLGYLASLPLTGYFAYYYYQIFDYIKDKIRIGRIIRRKRDTFRRMLSLKNDIINRVDQWVNQLDITN